jgi:hypothetical protein
VLRTTCIVVLLTMTGCLAACTDGASSEAEPAAAVTKAPALGACRLLTPGDIEHASNDSPAVPCSRKHTAQTFAVGAFPAAVAAKGMEAAELGAYVFRKCKPAFRRFVGADDSLVLRSTLTWAWFRSSKPAWRAGARYWRCDVVGAGDAGDRSASLQALPKTARGLLLGHPDDEWMVCVDGPSVSGSPKIPCSRTHTWRAVTTIVLGRSRDPYPGNRLSEVRTRDYCSDSVGAWMNYPVDYDYGYTWFHAADWKAGNRRSICWAKTSQ